MIKKEENLQNTNTKFKIKLTKKDTPLPKRKFGPGLYEQIKTPRTVKVYTGAGGLDLIDKALKNLYGNRQNPDFRREITEQADKLG